MKKTLIVVSIMTLGVIGFGMTAAHVIAAETGATAPVGTKSATPNIKSRSAGRASLETSEPIRRVDSKMIDKMEKADRVMDKMEKVENKTDSVRDSMSTSDKGKDSNKVAERGIHGRIEIATKSLGAMMERLTKLGNRIEERIKKLSANGVNVETSQKFLTSARADLAKAKVEIESARTAFTEEWSNNSANISANTSVNVNVSFPKTLAAVQAAKSTLKSAHANLVSAVRSFPNVNASTETDKTTNTGTTANPGFAR